MEGTPWLDRVLRLPPRRLEMSPARVCLGVSAPLAIAIAIAIFYYPLFLRIFVLNRGQYEAYVDNFSTVHPIRFWLPILLTPFSNFSTIVDSFRGRSLTLRRRVMIAAFVWALSIVPTTLYWLGEFRKAARPAADEVSPAVETP